MFDKKSKEFRMPQDGFTMHPIGYIRSELTEREKAPKQGNEGAPDAWLEVNPEVGKGLAGIAPGDEVIVITWFHKAHRDILKQHPRGDRRNPLTGVFATRSPDRPNPIGLHQVRILQISGNRLKIGPMEAIDGTPVVDIKPVRKTSAEASRVVQSKAIRQPAGK